MKFDVYKVLNLGFLGDGWDQCNIKLKSITVRQAREFAGLSNEKEKLFDKSMEILKDSFVEGTALVGGKVVPISASDMEDMPLSVINNAVELLIESREIDKKK